ncbi:MAG: D-aminopeptidase [Burkholderiaceae bacterium]|jgi:D-aminopeptidase
MHKFPALFDRTLATLPRRFPGPGGALAVLKDGVPIARHAWGFADIESRIPFTEQTLFRVCSITKEFTCALLLDRFSNPEELNPDVHVFLPELGPRVPAILDLCHNQSGLRDYWALAMLSGSPAEGHFGPSDAARVIGRARSLQFAPGTRYSYANQNFRLLAEILERRSGRSFGESLRAQVLEPVAMTTAHLGPDTACSLNGAIGYEGSLAEGFRPAVNRIHWTGDAGLVASLDDLIAWEAFIDHTREDANGLYRRLSAPPSFKDGKTAYYGFGLGHVSVWGRAATCHGGGLRGWRSFRVHVPAERVSVVVLFNHMADPRAAAMELLGALLEVKRPEAAAAVDTDGWEGQFVEPETGLSVRIEARSERELRLRFGPSAEILSAAGNGEFHGALTHLHRVRGVPWINRHRENLKGRLISCESSERTDIVGDYRCAELDSTLTCVMQSGSLYAAFSGEWGPGMMQPLVPAGRDLWIWPCARALDYEAPGDWTLRIHRDAQGKARRVQVGCWLARGIEYLSV